MQRLGVDGVVGDRQRISGVDVLERGHARRRHPAAKLIHRIPVLTRPAEQAVTVDRTHTMRLLGGSGQLAISYLVTSWRWD
jgi:hypothetical protein